MTYYHYYENFTEIFLTAEKTAAKYFNHYKDLFIASDYSLEDVIQEAKLGVIQAFKKFTDDNYEIVAQGAKPKSNKFKTYNDIYKLSNLKIGWRLKRILKNCEKYLSVYNSNKNKHLECYYCGENFRIIELKKDYYFCEVCDKKFKHGKLYSFPLNIDDETTSCEISSNSFTFIELYKILDNKEYDIFQEVFKYNNTFEQIGKKYNCSKQMANLIYQKAMKKVKKYFIDLK